MHPVNVSANLAGWLMLTATLLSIGFLLWFLVGMVTEGKKKTFRYVIHSACAERPIVHIFDESTVLQQPQVSQRQDSIRFNLDHINAGGMHKAPRLRSI